MMLNQADRGSRGLPGSQFERIEEPRTAKFVQLCASQNDLFALDEDGAVYQYHFNVTTWVKLIATRELEEKVQ
jgi:hypothetical protein